MAKQDKQRVHITLDNAESIVAAYGVKREFPYLRRYTGYTPSRLSNDKHGYPWDERKRVRFTDVTVYGTEYVHSGPIF